MGASAVAPTVPSLELSLPQSYSTKYLMLTVGLWQRAISLSNSEPVVVGFTELCCERDEIARVGFEPY